MYDFKSKYKEEIELNEDMFKTLCSYQTATEDKKALKMIRNHLQPKTVQAPPTLAPPPITTITTTTVTTTTIMNPPKRLTINVGKDANMGECIKEMETNKLFLKMKERAEIELDDSEMITI